VSARLLLAGEVQPLVRNLPICPDAVSVFGSLCDNGRREGTLMLESADTTAPTGEKSLLVLKSALALRCRNREVEVVAHTSNGQALRSWLTSLPFNAQIVQEDEQVTKFSFAPPPADGDPLARLCAPSPIDVPRALMQRLRPVGAEALTMPLLVGTFSYDLLGIIEDLPEAHTDPLQWPDFELWFAERMLWIDHRRERSLLVAFAVGGQNAERNYNDAAEATAVLADEIAALAVNKTNKRHAAASAQVSGAADTADTVDTNETPTNAAAISGTEAKGFTVDCSDEEFGALVKQLKGHIVAGDVFQIVASRTFSARCDNPLAAYHQLRAIDATPYMFYLAGSAGILFGASPETAVRVHSQPRQVEIRPIAGTRARARRPDGTIDLDLDSRLEAELRLDEKELAEHMMLVDLARNDAARVCKPATRTVHRLLGIEKYAYVMHLVSHITGELRDDFDALHAYMATANMGTLVGAPKIEAARLLRRYEATRRGPYGGAVGYLTCDGRMDTAIVIRSTVVKGNTAFVRAGAGIVFDSQPQAEADESKRKAQAVLNAIERSSRKEPE
jgi:anthranilate synthase component I